MTVEPLAYLAAAPKQRTEIPSLTQPTGVRDLLENPPHSRHSGFNLLTLDRARLVGGTRLRVSSRARKHIDLLSDGTLLAIGAFNEFLGWGREDFFTDPKANGLAVIEFTYDFVLLYERIVAEHLKPLPPEVRFQIGLRSGVYYDENGNERKLYLSPGPVGDFVAFDEYSRREAPGADFSTTMDAVVAAQQPHLDVGEIAFQLVRRFYNWFGHTNDAIPYVNEHGTAIDMGQIRGIR